MGKQGHGRRLTDKERMEIIEVTRQDPRIKHVELAARYNVNESTIRKWRLSANAEKIETRYGLGVEDVRDARQRGQVVRNAQFDAALFEWVSTMRTANTDLLPPSKIREKAKALSAQFDGMQDFKASTGWYYRFCRRYGLPCPPSSGGVKRCVTHVDSILAACAQLAPKSTDVAAALTESGTDGADQRVEADVRVFVAPQEPVREREKEEVRKPEPEREQETQASVSTSPGREQVVQTSALNSSEQEQEAQTTAVKSSVTTVTSPVIAPQGSNTPRMRSRKRKHEDVVVAEAETPERVAQVVSQRTGESPLHHRAPTPPPAATAVASPPSSPPRQPAAAVSPPPPAMPVAAATVSTPSPMTSPVLSARQEVIAHFLRHHKNLLNVASRLRFIKHLTHASEEVEMYAVMDDETRIEYIKEFADKGSDDVAPAGVVGESKV